MPASPHPPYLYRHPRSWCAHCSGLLQAEAGPAQIWNDAILYSHSDSASRALKTQKQDSRQYHHSLLYVHRAYFADCRHCSVLKALYWQNLQHSLCHAASCKTKEYKRNSMKSYLLFWNPEVLQANWKPCSFILQVSKALGPGDQLHYAMSLWPSEVGSIGSKRNSPVLTSTLLVERRSGGQEFSNSPRPCWRETKRKFHFKIN